MAQMLVSREITSENRPVRIFLAMPFYTPRRSDSSIIERKKPYLMWVYLFVCLVFFLIVRSDSGCHFLDGTCSTARTMHFGPCTMEQREAFSRVLRAHVSSVLSSETGF